MPCWPATTLIKIITTLIFFTKMGLSTAMTSTHKAAAATIMNTSQSPRLRLKRAITIARSQSQATTRTSKAAFHIAAAHTHTRTPLLPSFPSPRRTIRTLLTMTTTTNNSNNNNAKEYTIHIPDTTLPNTPLRPIHVLDTGIPTHTNTHTHTKSPLILIGGTAQTTQSWIGHIQPLSKERRLIIYEARGQGRKTDLNLKRATIQTHIEDFRQVHKALALEGPVDLAGFSFGGRVSLGVAAEAPELVNRLALTGVPAERDALGRLIIASWKASLEEGRLLDFAWSSMLNCHGLAFLAKNEKRIPEWVKFVVANNRAEAILSIVSQSHTTDITCPFHTLQLARRVQSPTLLLGGEEDRVACVEEVKRLAKEGGKNTHTHTHTHTQGWECEILPGVGHNSMLEDPKRWRDMITGFLDA